MDPVILLVEDDADHAELVVRSLERTPLGQMISVVETVAEAKAWLGACRADLVLSDLRLPDGSALELLGEGTPVVVMTSQGDEARAVGAMKGGAIDYLVKSPETYANLATLLERALRTCQTERDRRRAEASLRESEERFRQLADSIQEAFWLFDVREGRIVYASAAFERVYGETAGRVMATPAVRFDIVHFEDRERVRAALENEAPHRPLRHEYRVNSAASADQPRWIEERTFPIRGTDGLPYRVAGLGADVTRRRELEAALHQSQKMEAIGQLAGGIAHDFNNMLAAIMSSAERLRAVAPSPEEHELSDLILRASERASQLTKKLLTFSRKGRVRAVQVDVHEIIHDAIALLKRSVDPRVVIETDLKALSTTVIGDASELENAILNLGINARDAMPRGGRLTIGTVVRRLDEADCTASPFSITPGRFIQVSVSDTGQGIAPANVARIFEPFFTTKPVGAGTGLGLSAVHGTVVGHGGSVTVSSEVGIGTAIDIFLPLAEEEVVEGTAAARVSTVPISKREGLVLLVDDEPLLRKAGTRSLKHLGYEVVSAEDGVGGLEAFALHHERLVAVVCDAVMPLLSGGDAMARMRALDPTVPIILSSGFVRNDSLYAAEPDAFLGKPFRLSELAKVLENVARRLPPA
ncbi:MAG: response regulator [Labilithrix sp.]